MPFLHFAYILCDECGVHLHSVVNFDLAFVNENEFTLGRSPYHRGFLAGHVPYIKPLKGKI